LKIGAYQKNDVSICAVLLRFEVLQTETIILCLIIRN
jgi:hypothetical protein